MLEKKITFIGAGNMAQALVRALISQGYPSNYITVSNPSPGKLEKLHSETQVNTEQNNLIAAKEAEILVLCVKPQLLHSVCLELKDLIFHKKPLLISIAAGIKTDFFEHLFQNNIAVIRSMPNIPSVISAGASALCHNTFTKHDHLQMAEIIFRSVGVIAWVDESQMDAFTALAGIPAHIFLIMEVIQEVAEEMGISKENAKLFTLQTIFGSAKLALESEASFANLRESVTSAKGTTAAALKIFKEGHLAELLEKALIASKNRAKELSESINKAN